MMRELGNQVCTHGCRSSKQTSPHLGLSLPSSSQHCNAELAILLQVSFLGTALLLNKLLDSLKISVCY